MKLIDADDLKKYFEWCEVAMLSKKEIYQIIDNCPKISPYDVFLHELNRGDNNVKQ